MNKEILKLEPKMLWKYFSQLNAIPRATRKEAEAAAFVTEVVTRHGLEAVKDPAGNILVRKPATFGMENCSTIALQAHLDMVHQKSSGADFDFDTQGIEMYVEGDWVKARGTTLGADNGIGVAAMLAILTSDIILHPPLEALFTVGEEKGMTGALGLPAGLLKASAMLNLDTEEEGTITIGCAGRVAVVVNGTYEHETAPAHWQAYAININGLTGGHSGLEIHLGHGNAIKLLCKLLTAISGQCNFRLNRLSGGNLLNAIPREAKALVVVEDKYQFEEVIKVQARILQKLFAATDPKLEIYLQAVPSPENVMCAQDQQSILQVLNWCPDGVYTMSKDMPGLVQTSDNLAQLVLENGHYHLHCLTRGSVENEKMKLARSVKRAFAAIGAQAKLENTYSGWAPVPNAAFVKTVAEAYERLFETSPLVTAIHAGLECGIISGKYPEMEIVSVGPTILAAHSPEERVQISSVERFWELLLEVLASVPPHHKKNSGKGYSRKTGIAV